MNIEVENLSYAVGHKTLLRNVRTTFVPGQVCAVVGPNGAGKTSLLRVISGEVKVPSGRVRYGRRTLTRINLAQRALLRAVMTQSSRIVFDFSVAEVLQMGWVRPAGPLFKQQLQAVVDGCRISSLLSRRFNTLSGGEQQRVQFARAILQVCPIDPHPGPRYLLLDEPTASLDVAHELLVLRQVREAAAAGIGVVVVLHNLNLAGRFADRVLLMCDGALAAAGTPAEVFNNSLLSEVYATPMQVEYHQQLQRLMVYA